MNERRKKTIEAASEQTTSVRFQVSFSEEADSDLAAISDMATREVVIRRALELRLEPLSQGKPLRGDLKAYRSVRAAEQRYRIIYQVAVNAGTVTVVVVGIRRKGHKSAVYKIAGKRLD